MSFKPPHYARSGSFVVDGEEEGLAAPGDAAAEECVRSVFSDMKTEIRLVAATEALDCERRL